MQAPSQFLNNVVRTGKQASQATTRTIRLRLKKIHFGIQLLSEFDAAFLYVVQCLVTVDMWFTKPKEVEVGAIDHKNGLLSFTHCG